MSKQTIRSLAALILCLGLVSLVSVRAEDPKGAGGERSVTAKGEIVDLACYTDHGASGAKHQECALMCLKAGQPMGLLMSDGKVLLLLADKSDAKPFEEAKTYASMQVEITGPEAERGGIKAMTVKSVKKV